jgi:hypothetical protein
MRHLVTRETRCIRQRNRDGTVDSICSRCGLTISRAVHPDDLRVLETRHICQPAERRKKVRITHRIYDPIKTQQVSLFRDCNGWSGFSSELTTFDMSAESLPPCGRRVPMEIPSDDGVCETCAERGRPNEPVYKMGMCTFCYHGLRHPRATRELLERERMGAYARQHLGFLLRGEALQRGRPAVGLEASKRAQCRRIGMS